jgi:hypothetical protein
MKGTTVQLNEHVPYKPDAETHCEGERGSHPPIRHREGGVRSGTHVCSCPYSPLRSSGQICHRVPCSVEQGGEGGAKVHSNCASTQRGLLPCTLTPCASGEASSDAKAKAKRQAPSSKIQVIPPWRRRRLCRPARPVKGPTNQPEEAGGNNRGRVASSACSLSAIRMCRAPGPLRGRLCPCHWRDWPACVGHALGPSRCTRGRTADKTSKWTLGRHSRTSVHGPLWHPPRCCAAVTVSGPLGLCEWRARHSALLIRSQRCTGRAEPMNTDNTGCIVRC